MIESSPKNLSEKLLWIFLFLVAMLLIYQPWNYGILELQQSEGILAIQANEINLNLPMTTLHGIGIKNGYFLFPYIISLLKFHVPFLQNVPIEILIRSLQLFFTSVIGLIIFISAYRTKDLKAGLVSSIVFLGNALVFEKFLHASALMLSIMLVFFAHIIWFHFGVIKNKWNIAWIFSLLFISLAFLSNGFVTLIYFFLPLLFLHRPLKFKRKMQHIGFWLGLIIVLLTIILWALPYLIFRQDIKLTYLDCNIITIPEYLLQIVTFLFELIYRIWPITIIAWIPFCVALRPMDKTPIFSHFLRTIFFANFVFILLNPFSKIIDFIYVIAPAAILCGIYYDIAVRRYSQEIRRLAIFNALFLLFVAFCMLNFVLIPGEFLAKIIHIDYSEIRYLKENINHLYIIFFTSFIILTFGIWMFYYRKKRQIWFVLLTNIIAIAIFFWQIVYPLKSAKNERSNLGAELKRIISAENITNPQIFKSEILGLYSECYYLGYPVKKINSLNELPAEPETIYLLGIEFPQYPKRIWRNLLTQEYRGHTLYLWRGDLHKRKEFINRRIKQTETNANVKEK